MLAPWPPLPSYTAQSLFYAMHHSDSAFTLFCTRTRSVCPQVSCMHMWQGLHEHAHLASSLSTSVIHARTRPLLSIIASRARVLELGPVQVGGQTPLYEERVAW